MCVILVNIGEKLRIDWRWRLLQVLVAALLKP
jgi:hypothetical protein